MIGGTDQGPMCTLTESFIVLHFDHIVKFWKRCWNIWLVL